MASASSNMMLSVVAMGFIVGCGGRSVEEAWESAGARTGWYEGGGSGFSVEAEKPSADAIPGYWAHTEFDFDQLATLPIPPKPFALHFGGSELTDAHLKQAIRFREAEYLGLNRTRVTDAGMPSILSFPNLKTLDLGYANVGDEGVETISKASKLSTLILFATNVTDSGAGSVCQIETLEVLDVSDTSITDLGFQKLVSLPKLRYLGVANTRVSPEAIAAIQERRPELEIDQ